MQSKWIWMIRRRLDKIWVTVVAYGLLGVLVVLAAPFVGQFLPSGISIKMGAGAVEPILKILASSMLTVTTFSLSIMVAAYSAAAGSATPRALELLLKDRTTQRVLASFIGAFIYSLVGLVSLQAGLYGEERHFVLFITTIALITIIVVNLVRWVSHLTTFGRLTDTVARMEVAATTALQARICDPYLGAHRAGAVPSGAVPICARDVGYVQHIDVARLNGIAEALGLRIWIAAMPGKLVHSRHALVRVLGTHGQTALPESVAQELRDGICEAFTIAQMRTYDQDPEFGVITLAEVAQRALSPAVNDPGTAIDVTSRLLRILSGVTDEAAPELRFSRVWVPELDAGALLRQSLAPIAREGAGCLEVVLHVVEAATALAQIAPEAYGKAGREIALEAQARAAEAMRLPADLEAINMRIEQAGWAPVEPEASGA